LLMGDTWKKDRLALQALLRDEPSARARYARLAGYERELCFRWIADAPTALLREQRIRRLARRLWLTSFEPMYDIGSLAFAELDDLYGSPRFLHHLSPAEQALALQEQRVLGGNHSRNYDDADVRFRIVAPEDKLLDDILMAYARPCVLTEQTVEWLNCNGWERIDEVRTWFDLTKDDEPPASPR
jgi:hypothetical protein